MASRCCRLPRVRPMRCTLGGLCWRLQPVGQWEPQSLGVPIWPRSRFMQAWPACTASGEHRCQRRMVFVKSSVHMNMCEKSS